MMTKEIIETIIEDEEIKAQTIPTGTDDFYKVRTVGYYYVDKTMMIRDFLAFNKEVTLISRPRRFGKTLNMTMLREFFDITKESVAIFEGLAIMKSKYAVRMNSIPVIFFTLKGCKSDTFEGMKTDIAACLFDEFDKYYKIFKAAAVDDSESEYRRFYEAHQTLELEEPSERLLKISLVCLMKAVHKFYGIRPIVLIDEYDVPIINAHAFGFRSKLTGLLSMFFTRALKGNPDLDKAVLTGIQRIAKESIFSELNNLSVYTVIDERYASYFGFTPPEVEQALIDHNTLAAIDEVRAYYDGYVFGEKYHIYNPWSILSFIEYRKLESYWMNTSINLLIRELVIHSTDLFVDSFHKLIEKGEAEVGINLKASFFELEEEETLWGLLVNAGYLTIIDVFSEDAMTVKIPNNEARREFLKIVSKRNELNTTNLSRMFDSLFQVNIEKFLKNYQELIYHYVSSHDIMSENSFHMLFLGMAISSSGMYQITSNIEAGDGRPDIVMESLLPDVRPHIVVEFKREDRVMRERKLNNSEMQEYTMGLANEAVTQIVKKNYAAKLTGSVLAVGVGHYKKHVQVMHQMIEVD